MRTYLLRNMYTFMADLNYVYCKDAYSEQLNMV